MPWTATAEPRPRRNQPSRRLTYSFFYKRGTGPPALRVLVLSGKASDSCAYDSFTLSIHHGQALDAGCGPRGGTLGALASPRKAKG